MNECDDLSILGSLIASSAVADDDDIITEFCNQASSATLVLLGESTHGTQQYYEIRSRISKRLIDHHGFSGVVLEASMVDCVDVNDSSIDIDVAKSKFECRFPKWMWSNNVMTHFYKYLRTKDIPLFGFDCYAIGENVQHVLQYLSGCGDEALYKEAIVSYSTLLDYVDDMARYKHDISQGNIKSCCAEVTNIFLLIESKQLYNYDWFIALQCSRAVKTAERYFRGKQPGQSVNVDTWNIRDQHMSDVVQQVLIYQQIIGVQRPKLIIWAHNSHVGDARGTSYTERGQWNVGQLLRESFGLPNVYNLGFLTNGGTVRASSSWGAPSTINEMQQGVSTSWSNVMKHSKLKKFLLILRSMDNSEDKDALDTDMIRALTSARSQRAIGVIYKPEAEAVSHIFTSCLPYQFDSIIYIENTTALLK